MGPYTGVLAEIGVVKARAIRVAVDPDRARRKRPQADELAFAEVLHAIVGHDLYVETKTHALAVAAVHRQQRIAEHETADHVGAARDRMDGDMLEVVADPVVLRLVEDRARRLDDAQAREAAHLARHDRQLRQRV